MNLNYWEQSDKYIAYFDVCADDINRIYVKVFCKDRDMYDRVVACLNTSFSYKDPNAANTFEYKSGLYDGIIRLFNKKTNSLDTGLIVRAHQYLSIGVPEVTIEWSSTLSRLMIREVELPTKDYSDFIKSLNIVNQDNEKIDAYDHQIRLLEFGVNTKRSSMVACTGSGKSLAQYSLSRWFMEREKRKTLIIVPSAGLVEQMYSDFKNDYGWADIDNHCTLIYADSKDKLTKKEKDALLSLNLGEESKLKDVVISTWQSLLNKDVSFFNVFGAVMVDEAHGAKADELRRIVNQCTNADWKIGLSGTIPDDGLDAALIEGSLGRRIEIVRSNELINKSILTPVEIHMLYLGYEIDVRPYVCRQEYRDECSLFAMNGSRQKVFDVMVKANKITTVDNTLILFRRKESINDMKEFIEKYFPQFKVRVIIGDVKASLREQYRKEIDSAGGYIVLATYGTMKQGVNIKRLHNLMFAEWSKSMYEIIQSIGRILRRHSTKKKAYVYDIVDNCSYITKKGLGTLRHNYAMQHAMHRASYYKSEQFPVIEYNFPFTVSIDPKNLDMKKQNAAKAKKPAAKAKATTKKSSKKSQPTQTGGLGKNSLFLL